MVLSFLLFPAYPVSSRNPSINKLINSHPTNPGYDPYRLKVLHSRTEQVQG